VYRRTTIAAVATALALLGGGSALAANAGLFDGDRPDGAGTLPAVTTPDTGPTGDPTTPPSQTPTDVAPSPGDGDSYQDGESYQNGEPDEDGGVERDD
jgi:hypothetical protein